MKKAFAVLVSALFLFGFAASAFAIHAEIPVETSAVVAKGEGTLITLDGSLRMRGATQRDANGDLSGSDAGSSDFSSYDTRIRLGTKAEVGPVTGYVQLETGSGSSDVAGWGKDGANGLYMGGYKTIGTLTVLQAWVNYTFGNAGVKVGHMPLALGKKIFFDHTGSGDDAIVAYMNPTSATHVAGLIVKFHEGASNSSADDIDGYVALATHKLSDALALGADVTHLRNNASEMQFWNVGLDASGKAGMVSWWIDGQFQFGDLSSTVDQSAYAFAGNVTGDLGSGKAWLELGWGSGDDGSDATKNENFTAFLTDTRYFSTLVGYRLAVPGQGHKNSGLGNMFYVQLGGSTKTVCPLTKKDLALKARLNWMQLNEDVNNESDLGFEIELFPTWTLSKGLKYYIEFAWLFSGDAWNPGGTVDDAYFLRHGIQMAF